MIVTRRNDSVDFLRGFSIVSVIALHIAPYANLLSFFPVSLDYLQDYYWKWTLNGYYGVSVFFVISGFLITKAILYQYGALHLVGLRAFYVRRAARIIPLLLLFCVVSIALSCSFAAFRPSDRSMLVEVLLDTILFRSNIFYLRHNVVPGLLAWVPLWSLAVEEQFYIGYPLLLKIVRGRWALMLLVVIALTGALRRASIDDLYTLSGCADCMSWGCLAAICQKKLDMKSVARMKLQVIRVTGFLAIMAVFFVVPIAQNFTWAPTVISIVASLFLITTAVDNEPAPNRVYDVLLAAPMRLCGRLSYELYIFHLSFIVLGSAYLIPRDIPGLWIALTAAMIAVCFLISKFYTEPLSQRLRLKYEKDTARPEVGQQPS